MRHEYDRCATTTEFFEPLVTLLLERSVANGENFINDQNVRFNMRRDGESEARVHSRGIPLHRRIDELANPREIDDRIQLARNFGTLHPEDRALQIQVFPAGQVKVETGRNLDQRSDSPAGPAAALCRPQYPCQ